MLCCTMHCQVGKETPKIAPLPWDFVTLPEEDRATAIGNRHDRFDKDRACGSGDILVHRQTHIQTYSLQYFATSVAGELITAACLKVATPCENKKMGTRSCAHLMNIGIIIVSYFNEALANSRYSIHCIWNYDPW